MAAMTNELADIIRELPEEKAQEVVDFARFLQQQAGDLAWERIIEDKHPRPKMDAFVADALCEGPSEPLDPNKL
jgi:Protein of unknown function (DUF2281)